MFWYLLLQEGIKQKRKLTKFFTNHRENDKGDIKTILKRLFNIGAYIVKRFCFIFKVRL